MAIIPEPSSSKNLETANLRAKELQDFQGSLENCVLARLVQTQVEEEQVILGIYFRSTLVF